MTFTISGFGREQTGKRESIPMNGTNQRTVAPQKVGGAGQLPRQGWSVGILQRPVRPESWGSGVCGGQAGRSAGVCGRRELQLQDQAV